jgi:hypothetical protein
MPPNFEHFLHRARRNWTAWTIAEHAGMGLLFGCVCVLLLLPILLWRGQPNETIAMVFPLLGLLIGAIAGLRARPSLGDVARLADERFNTADLLSTALALRGSVDPWHINIVKMADHCAIGLSPSALAPHRLGRRAWSGIVLAFTAAVTLGLFSITMPANRAQAVNAPAAPGALNEWERPGGNFRDSSAMQTIASREAKAQNAPDSESMQGSGDKSSGDSSVQRSDRSSREGQAEMGAGGGSARTDSAQAATPGDHSVAQSKNASASGAIAAGGQGREAAIFGSGGTTAGEVSEQHTPTVPPWAGDDWPAKQSAAVNAINNGQIPDQYRDLVRDYFDRSDAALHRR